MTTSDWISLVMAILVGGGTLSLAFMTWKSIRQTRGIQESEKKERLLNEIIEWAVDIQKASLDIDIPVTGGLLSKSERTRIETNVLLRYGIAFLKNDYIRTAAYKAFKKELQNDVENAINNFTAFLFLKGKSFGFKNAKQPFRGTALKIMEEVEKQIEEENKTVDQLLNEYSEKLAYSMNVLLVKIGNIKASL